MRKARQLELSVRTIRHFLIVVLCWSSNILPRATSSRQGQTSSSYSFNTPNKYVTSSPPCLAALCRNGIALIALHIPDSALGENIGPARVEKLDHNAVLLNAGWRVDGAVLAEGGREICSRDSALYGPPSSSEFAKDRDYGIRLGWGLVDYLVGCHVKGSSRSLSTVGLLATNAFENELYLVDATGLYPCRAMAVGSHSSQINRFLFRVDFMKMDVEDGAEVLLSILRDCRRGKFPHVIERNDDDDIKNAKDEDDHAWHIPDSSMVELAVMKSKGKITHRRKEIFLPSSS